MSSSFKDSLVPRASKSGIMSCLSLDSAKEMDSMCGNKEKRETKLDTTKADYFKDKFYLFYPYLPSVLRILVELRLP